MSVINRNAGGRRGLGLSLDGGNQSESPAPPVVESKSEEKDIIDRALDVADVRPKKKEPAVDLPPVGRPQRCILFSPENFRRLQLARNEGFSMNGFVNAAVKYYFEQKYSHIEG